MLGLLFCGAMIGSAFGLTVPVAQNSFTSQVGSGSVIYIANGDGAYMPVNGRNTALLQFNLSYPAVPPEITTQNLTSATLQFYVINAAPAGNLNILYVTSPWSVTFPGRSEPAPSISSTVIATVPASQIARRSFVSVDVTNAVRVALASGTSYGFAIAAGGATKLAVASSNDPAIGYAATLDLETNGQLPDHTTSIGYEALEAEPAGFYNVGIGETALYADVTGSDNVGCGAGALEHNVVGSNNTACGSAALFSSTDGNFNTAVGSSALGHSIGGTNNTAVGDDALLASLFGNENVALGVEALYENVIGNQNTAAGTAALLSSTDGINNVAVGEFAGSVLTTGSNNIYIGNWSGNGPSSEPASESGVIRIGSPALGTAAYIAGINNATISGGAQVFVDPTDGQLGEETSSGRYKTGISPMGDASNLLYSLKPVTFRYKPQYDPKGIPQYGLVAEDVAKISPGLVVRDARGEIQTVRYEQVNAMLLNEFLKEHRLVNQQAAQLHDQEKAIAGQQSQLDSMTAAMTAMQQQLTSISHQLTGHAMPVANGSDKTNTAATSAPSE